MAIETKAVAFDLDGTLYPNHSLYIRLLPFAFRHGRLLAAFSKARNIIRRKQDCSPSSFKTDFYEYQARLTAELLKSPPEEIKEKIDRLIYRGWEPFFSRIKMFPHVTETLEKLREAGFKLGLLSDFPTAAKLENMGISGFWDAVLCSEDAGALKPSRRPFDLLCEELACRPEEVLYVGNSRPYDVSGAKLAGMKAALKTSRIRAGGFFKAGAGADLVFHDYRQLCDFMLK